MAIYNLGTTPMEPRRYSLRLPRSPWWIVAAIILSIAAAAIRYGLSAYRQQAIINEIKKGGGDVWVEPRGPAWFRQFQADRRLGGCGTVTIVACVGDDETIARLRQFRGLKRLHLWSTHRPITNRGMEHLSELRKLTELWVVGDFDDASLASLSGLSGLKQLMLFSPNVTDGAITHLARLKNLEWLDLQQSKVTEAGLIRLRKLLPNAQVDKFEMMYRIKFPGEEFRSRPM